MKARLLARNNNLGRSTKTLKYGRSYCHLVNLSVFFFVVAAFLSYINSSPLVVVLFFMVFAIAGIMTRYFMYISEIEFSENCDHFVLKNIGKYQIKYSNCYIFETTRVTTTILLDDTISFHIFGLHLTKITINRLMDGYDNFVSNIYIALDKQDKAKEGDVVIKSRSEVKICYWFCLVMLCSIFVLVFAISDLRMRNDLPFVFSFTALCFISISFPLYLLYSHQIQFEHGNPYIQIAYKNRRKQLYRGQIDRIICKSATGSLTLHCHKEDRSFKYTVYFADDYAYQCLMRWYKHK